MVYLLVKTLITAGIIVAVTELSKRFPFAAAFLIALPTMSILAFIWIYYESRDTAKIITMSYSIFWLVIPALLFFLLLPALLKAGIKFTPAMLLSSLALALIYGAATYAYRRWVQH